MPLLALALTGLFEGFFTRFHYLAPFTVLILCGLGAPFPEEVALIGSGILLHRGEVDFVTITLVCSGAILLGDSLPFWLGRRYGMKALRFRWVRRVLHPERISLLERRFVEHGNWVVFSCRFLPGVRIPGYFFAGTMRMTFLRFLLLDGLGVLISVPTSIWLGKLFGQSVESLRERFDQLHLVLAFAVLTIVLILFLRSRNRIRERQAAVAAQKRERPLDPSSPQEPSGSAAGPSTEHAGAERDASAGPEAPDARNAPGAPGAENAADAAESSRLRAGD